MTANRQTAGRGRSGRSWSSSPGNLLASLLLRLDCATAVSPQLSFVSALAVFAAIEAHLPAATARHLRLKWPNDVLHQDSKLGGILIESSITAPSTIDFVIGIGINVASHPGDLARPTTCLAALGATVSVRQLLNGLDLALQAELRSWNAGDGFQQTRTRWLDRGTELGARIAVHSGRDIERGTFSGLDLDGALLLKADTGALRRIGFGDVEVVRPPAGFTAKGD